VHPLKKSQNLPEKVERLPPTGWSLLIAEVKISLQGFAVHLHGFHGVDIRGCWRNKLPVIKVA